MTEEPQTYTLVQKWDAIGKHMLSNGMENADLGEKLGGLHKDTIRKARNGTKPFAGTAIMDSIPAIFGATNYDDLVVQANAMPDMSSEKVMDAIYRMAAHKKMHLKEVVERSGYTSKLFSAPTVGTKVAYAVATKSFGFGSIAEMVKKAQKFPAVERRTLRTNKNTPNAEDDGKHNAISDELLTEATRILQKRNGFTDTEIAEGLGITRSMYTTSIKNKRFQSDEERTKLAALFGFETRRDMVESALLPEGVPMGMMMGLAHHLQMELGIQDIKFLAEKLGVTPDNYNYQTRREERYSLATMQRLPSLFGVKTLQEVADKAKNLELMPEREEFATALKRVLAFKLVTADQLAKNIGGSLSNVERIVGGQYTVDSCWLRKIPAALGYESMQQMIDAGSTMPDTPRKSVAWQNLAKKARNGGTDLSLEQGMRSWGQSIRDPDDEPKRGR